MSQRPTRHQMRRHVRKMRRYGLQPMTIVNPGDPLPETVFVVIYRWAWRYRSELAPFGVALATAAVAWWLHGHDARWSLTLGMRPGELRGLRWDHVDLGKGVIHVWRSARRGGEVKTPKSRRSLILSKRAVAALRAHRKRQAAERLTAGEDWQDNNLVFCQPDGRPYTRDALNWRFGKMTRRAGLGHWHAHEARHTAVSIMSTNGVPIQEISDTVGHKSTHVTETVYRHVIVPAIRGGATVMDDVFGDFETDSG